MTLREWRNSKKWSQQHLANCISKRLGRPISQPHIQGWETDVMPGADVAEAIRQLSHGKVKGDSFKGKEK